MAELDIINVFNPTSEDFTHGFNGEDYTIEAGKIRPLSQYVGFHLAHHLAKKMVEAEITKAEKKNNPTILSQRQVYDNPWLRVALYKILKSTDLVQQVISVYPYKGFIGDMGIYEKFVAKEESQSKDSEKVKN
jgi:hypothetical protein